MARIIEKRKFRGRQLAVIRHCIRQLGPLISQSGEAVNPILTGVDFVKAVDLLFALNAARVARVQITIT
jgi:hypothetical protein